MYKATPIFLLIPTRMALDFAATYKILVLGDSGGNLGVKGIFNEKKIKVLLKLPLPVGKTCIVHRYCDERYYDTYISTIGESFKRPGRV